MHTEQFVATIYNREALRDPAQELRKRTKNGGNQPLSWKQLAKEVGIEYMTEKLIKAVYERKPLWDAPYVKKGVQSLPLWKLWNEVAQEMCVDAVVARRKWMNLRSYFKHELRKIRKSKLAGQPVQSKWKFYNKLLFLEQSTGMKFTSDLANDISRDIHTDISAGCSDEDNVYLLTVIPESSDNKYTYSSNVNWKVEEIKSDIVIKEEPLCILGDVWSITENGDLGSLTEDSTNNGEPQGTQESKPQNIGVSQYDEDSDLEFYKNLIPYMNELSEIQKLRVRTKIQNLILSELEVDKQLLL